MKRNPKPDYDHIATMEMDIFGDTWVDLDKLSLRVRNQITLRRHFTKPPRRNPRMVSR